MTVNVVTGDLFESKAEVWVNAVNCKGVMGKGIAKQFAQRYPRMLATYKSCCANLQLRPGEVLVYRTDLEQPKFVYNIATKNHWRHVSRLEWIYDGVMTCMDWMMRDNLHKIAMPALGCGEGGLDFDTVHKLISDATGIMRYGYNIEILLYKPHEAK